MEAAHPLRHERRSFRAEYLMMNKSVNDPFLSAIPVSDPEDIDDSADIQESGEEFIENPDPENPDGATETGADEKVSAELFRKGLKIFSKDRRSGYLAVPGNPPAVTLFEGGDVRRPGTETTIQAIIGQGMIFSDGRPVRPEYFLTAAPKGFSPVDRAGAFHDDRMKDAIQTGKAGPRIEQRPPEQTRVPGIFDYIRGFCQTIRESVRRKREQHIAEDQFFPVPQRVFGEKISRILKIWEFRRDAFEEAWAELQKTKFLIESECKKLRENPIMLRFLEEYRRAGDDGARVRVLAELRKHMQDQYSEYARSLRLNVENLERGIGQLHKCARISLEASGAEPLERLGCPDAVENDVRKFISGFHNRPELEIVRDENNRSLHQKFADIGEELARMFQEFKASLISLIRSESPEAEGTRAGMRPRG